MYPSPDGSDSPWSRRTWSFAGTELLQKARQFYSYVQRSRRRRRSSTYRYSHPGRPRSQPGAGQLSDEAPRRRQLAARAGVCSRWPRRGRVRLLADAQTAKRVAARPVYDAGRTRAEGLVCQLPPTWGKTVWDFRHVRFEQTGRISRVRPADFAILSLPFDADLQRLTVSLRNRIAQAFVTRRRGSSVF
jgi:hypothetical protein